MVRNHVGTLDMFVLRVQVVTLAVIPPRIGIYRAIHVAERNHVGQTAGHVMRVQVAIRVVMSPPIGIANLPMHVGHAGPMVRLAIVDLPVTYAVAVALIGLAKVRQHVAKNRVEPMERDVM